MKNVKRFDTESAYNAFVNTNAFVRPNISLCADTYSIVYNKVLPTAHDYSLDYFTLVALENGSFKIENAWDNTSYGEDLYRKWNDELNNGEGGYDGYGVKYSLDNGNTWNNFEFDDVNWEDGYTAVSVNAGDKMLIKSIRMVWESESSAPYKIVATGQFNVEGNIMSLIWGDDFIDKTNFLNNYDIPESGDTDYRGYNALMQLFYGNTYLISAENLILPALQLGEACYSSMFQGCTSLIAAPILPATTLAEYCYTNMFFGCTSLTTAPDLLAPTLEANCYSYMFYGCSSLNYIKMLATSMYVDDLDTWVDGVAASGTFVKSIDMTELDEGMSGIPSGWTVESV